jgi:hypothetical protein
VSASPRGTGAHRPVSPSAPAEDHWLHATPGRAWRLLLALVAYSVTLGVIAIAAGQLAVTLTRGMLPETAVRIGMVLVAVVVAGAAGNRVLAHLKRTFDW